MSLILASGSPRRLHLLRELGLAPIVIPADIDETPLQNEAAAAYVERLAIEKGAAIASDVGGNDVVVSADTIVVLDGELLGPRMDHPEPAHVIGRPGTSPDSTACYFYPCTREAQRCHSRLPFLDRQKRTI